MFRHLFTLLSIVLLLLCAATVVLWVRSYGIGDGWNRDMTYGRAVYSHDGSLVIVDRWDPPPRLSTVLTRTSAVIPVPERSDEWGPPGFHWTERWLAMDPARPADFSIRFQRNIELRYWLITVLTGATLPFWIVGILRRRHQQKRQKQGLCLHCGYDIRATPDRCPECGVAPNAKPA